MSGLFLVEWGWDYGILSKTWEYFGYTWNFYMFENPGQFKIAVDISLILGYLITVIFDYQIPHKPLKILSL